MADPPRSPRTLFGSPPSELAEHATPPIADVRVQRLWGGVRAGLERRERRLGFWSASFRWVTVTVVVLLVAVAGRQLWTAEDHVSLVEGAAFETASDSLAVDLQDGSRLNVSPETRVALTTASRESVTLDLDRGRVSCDVSHHPERQFVVRAGAVRVRVVGTKFSVQRSKDDEQVSVRVERGIVEVTSGDGRIKRLGAGETWTWNGSERTSDAAPAPAAVEAPDVASPSRVEPTADEAPADEAANVAARSPVAPAVHEDPLDLFQRAMAERRSGNAAEASRLFARFTARHPNHRQAGVAWFELGRLRMDRLGDMRGAERALTSAVATGVGALDDDARARLVQARAALGMETGCRQARESYLERYPSGVHIEVVRRLCAP